MFRLLIFGLPWLHEGANSADTLATLPDYRTPLSIVFDYNDWSMLFQLNHPIFYTYPTLHLFPTLRHMFGIFFFSKKNLLSPQHVVYFAKFGKFNIICFVNIAFCTKKKKKNVPLYKYANFSYYVRRIAEKRHEP